MTLITLILLGLAAYAAGRVATLLKLPDLIGMLLLGMLIGPAFLNLIPSHVLALSAPFRDVALIAILFIGGLGISLSQMRQIGRPTLLLSIVPALLEGFFIAWLTTLFLDFSFVQGAILGFIIASVSPSILIPSMANLISHGIGVKKAIPQMLLVGASTNGTVSIAVFTTFLTLYHQSDAPLLSEIFKIPVSLLLSATSAFLMFKITEKVVPFLKSSIGKTGFMFGSCLLLHFLQIPLLNSLLAVVLYGFFVHNFMSSEPVLRQMNRLWKIGKLYLFVFVGMMINPHLIGSYVNLGLLILSLALTLRSFGVLLSLMGTNLTKKERLFYVIAYLPKATVQAAKASIPLQMGVAGGEVIQALAILSVLVTAPIGAIGIKLGSRWLE